MDYVKNCNFLTTEITIDEYEKYIDTNLFVWHVLFSEAHALFFSFVNIHYERSFYMNSQNQSFYIKAAEVAMVMGISKQYAYRIIKQLNEELQKKGALVIEGRTNREYFYQRLIGQTA